METTHEHRLPTATEPGRYETCEECGAPMDQQQRYCVNCAARRKDTENPATRYLATNARRTRRPPTGTRPVQTGSGGRAAAVAFFALLPIAVAVGVLVGRGGSNDNGDQEALLKALNKQNATAAATPTATSGTTASNVQLSSDFSLDKGYTVKLETLPINGTDQAAADKAKADAQSKGAKQLGIINPGDFSTTPDQGANNYVLYSGQYKQRGQAEQALKKLKSKFKSAAVIAVKSTSGGAAGGKVVAKTRYGSVHKVAGFKSTPKQEAQGAQIAQSVANTTGQDYVQQEKNLPDVIPVGPSTGSSGTTAPKGAGD